MMKEPKNKSFKFYHDWKQKLRCLSYRITNYPKKLTPIWFWNSKKKKKWIQYTASHDFFKKSVLQFCSPEKKKTHTHTHTKNKPPPKKTHFPKSNSKSQLLLNNHRESGLNSNHFAPHKVTKVVFTWLRISGNFVQDKYSGALQLYY